MDIFDIHSVKMQKANAMLQYQQFKKIATLFRFAELFLAVVFFSWISIRLPFVIGVFSDYFRQLLSIIVSPLFIFLVGNVIIVTLVVKSGHENYSDVDNAGGNMYEQMANNVQEDVSPVMKPEEIVYHDKRIVWESNTKPIGDYCCNENNIKISQDTKKQSVNSAPDLDLKVYRRSQSENLMKTECDLQPNKFNSKFRRSETEIGCRKVDTPVENNVVDELNNEEFQRKIEGFIARQIRFLHEEKFAIVADMNA